MFLAGFAALAAVAAGPLWVFLAASWHRPAPRQPARMGLEAQPNIERLAGQRSTQEQNDAKGRDDEGFRTVSSKDLRSMRRVQRGDRMKDWEVAKARPRTFEPFKRSASSVSKIRSIATLQELIDVLEETRRDGFDGGDENLEYFVGTAFHRLGRFRAETPNDIDIPYAVNLALIFFAKLRVEELRVGSIANIVWAIGKMRMRNHKVLPTLFQQAKASLVNGEEWTADHAVQMLNGLAFLKEETQTELVGLLVGRIGERLTDLQPFHFVTIGKSFKTLKYRNDVFLRAYCNFVSDWHTDFEEKDLRRILYSLSFLGYRHRRFLDTFCDYMTPRLDGLENKRHVQELGESILRLRHPHEEFITAYSTVVARRIKFFIEMIREVEKGAEKGTGNRFGLQMSMRDVMPDLQRLLTTARQKAKAKATAVANELEQQQDEASAVAGPTDQDRQPAQAKAITAAGPTAAGRRSADNDPLEEGEARAVRAAGPRAAGPRAAGPRSAAEYPPMDEE